MSANRHKESMREQGRDIAKLQDSASRERGRLMDKLEAMRLALQVGREGGGVKACCMMMTPDAPLCRGVVLRTLFLGGWGGAGREAGLGP